MLHNTENKVALARRLTAIQDLIVAAAELIDEQVLLVDTLQHNGQPAIEADHTLELMMDMQVAHVMYRDLLSEALLNGPH